MKPNLKGTTILHQACKRGHITVVQYLLSAENLRININATRQNGMTPLMQAVQKNRLLVVQMLNEAGADF